MMINMHDLLIQCLQINKFLNQKFNLKSYLLINLSVTIFFKKGSHVR